MSRRLPFSALAAALALAGYLATGAAITCRLSVADIAPRAALALAAGALQAL